MRINCLWLKTGDVNSSMEICVIDSCESFQGQQIMNFLAETKWFRNFTLLSKNHKNDI